MGFSPGPCSGTVILSAAKNPRISPLPVLVVILSGAFRSLIAGGAVEGPPCSSSRHSSSALFNQPLQLTSLSPCTPPPPFATLYLHVHAVQTLLSLESCPRHPRPPPARDRPLEPRRIHRPRRLRPLWLRRDPHPDLRGHRLFARGVGEETDIVSKEMYTWEDRARAQSERAQSLTLRPENTAGVVRAYIEHNLGDSGQLQKLFYIGPQFRRERPQRGRYRQFWQIGAEFLARHLRLRDRHCATPKSWRCSPPSSTSWASTAGSCNSTPSALPKTARATRSLREALAPIKHQLCEDNQRRAETNPLRVLDSRTPRTRPSSTRSQDRRLPRRTPAATTSPRSAPRSTPAAWRTPSTRALSAASTTTPAPPSSSPFLVRRSSQRPRHAERPARRRPLRRPLRDARRPARPRHRLRHRRRPPHPHPASAIREQPSNLDLEPRTTKLDAYIAPLGPERNPAALALARELRQAGLSVEVGDGTFKAGKSLETAEKKARRILFIGDFESKAGIFVVKDFASERSRLFARRDLEKELRKAAWKVVVPLAG